MSSRKPAEDIVGQPAGHSHETFSLAKAY